MRVSSITESDLHGARQERVLAVEDRAMRAAIRLARRGIGTTHPNPRVGAVVLRDGAVVGEGFHARAGEAHAEVLALGAAEDRARGGTLVLTMEPCAHFGRTPPCIDAILGAGIRRVIVGMRDPNPLVNGRGIQRLGSAGIEVIEGVRAAECRDLNFPYLKHLATGLPWVMLKSMVSLDGRVATETGDSRGLGSQAEQRLAHRLRAQHDAVLVGVGTVLADDPELTVRLARGRNPLRVVLDTHLRTPLSSRLVATTNKAPLLIATASRDRERIGALEALGARIWRFSPGEDGRVTLRPLLSRLAQESILAILVEGGPAVHSAFLREELVDRVAIGIAPIIVGGTRATSWTQDLGRTRLHEAIAVGSLAVRRVGRDIWLEGSLPANGGEDV